MNYFSLFSGIGGFELGILRSYRKKNERSQTNTQNYDETRKGLESSKSKGISPKNRWISQQPNSYSNSGATCVGFSEIDKYATSIYKTHFPTHKEYGDVTNIKWSNTENFDLLVGGFPCQAFSIAGKRQGFDDTRGTLFFEIARCLKEKQPRLLLLENVKGLLSHDKGRTFGTILNTLDELGYDLQWQVLNSKNFGVPQNRERVFIVGHLRGTSRPQVFPIREIGKANNEKKPSRTIKIKKEQFGKHQQDCILDISGLYPTLASNTTFDKWDIELQDLQIRRLTPTECERLQGFPDGWTEGISDTQRYKCLGNAVTVNVILAIAKKLLTSPAGYIKIDVNERKPEKNTIFCGGNKTNKKYQIIYADPPWSYFDQGCQGAMANHYKGMKIADICALPIQKITDNDCILFLWATYPMLREALQVIEKWGFQYKSIAFQWLKLNPKALTPFYGLGRWTRGNTEPCLLATKGKPKRISKSVFQLIQTPRRKHSQKPIEARVKIIQLIGDLPRIELFAREKTPGWDVWGNEVDSDISLTENSASGGRCPNENLPHVSESRQRIINEASAALKKGQK